MLSKKHIQLLFVVLLCAYNSVGQTTFNKYFPFSKDTKPSDIIKNKDSTYTLISQFTNSVTDVQGLVLTKFDKFGNVQIQKDYLSNTPESYYVYLKNRMAIPINASSFLLTGGCSDTNNTTGFLITKINAQTLDTSWVKYYSLPLYDLPMSNIVKITSNRYWLIGNKFDNNNTSYAVRPVIYETDTLGNITFRKELTALLNYSQNRITYDSIQQRLYIAGTTSNQQSFVACLDTTGALLWNKQIAGNPYFTQIEKRSNYIVLSGSKLESTNDQIYLLKLYSNNGGLIWGKTYWDEGLGNVLSAFIINNDESIAAVGSHRNPEIDIGSNWNGIILKVDSNGDSLWLRSYSNYLGNVEEGFIDVQQSFDGGYIMAGAPFFAPTYYSWVVKTDSLGNGPGVVVPSTTTAISELAGEAALNLYPNPASNQVIIQADIEALNSGPVKLMIYNAAGELIKEEEPTFKNKRTTLKTSDLQNGIYFVKLQCDNKIFEASLLLLGKLSLTRILVNSNIPKEI